MAKKLKVNKPNWKKLYNKAYALWKECAFLIYGRECQVQNHYPYIWLMHSNVMQVDHVFTRANKHLHLDIRNGVPICSNCNAAKSWKQKGIDLAIYKICQKKIGETAFDEITGLAYHSGPLKEWKTIWYMEKQIEDLEEIKRKLNEQRQIS